MRICIVGGRLQGLEAAWLAREAGIETAVIDRRPSPPAASLADNFRRAELPCPLDDARRLFSGSGLVVPAVEDDAVLAWLAEAAAALRIPLAFDPGAYAVSSSKIRSNRVLAAAGVPLPRPWPECGFPAVVKPSDRSGSEGVGRADDDRGLAALLATLPADAVVQEFLEGPSYSLEVLGHRGACLPFAVTELHFDAAYDCKRVVAGPATGEAIAGEFREVGRLCAAAVGLSGIMDVEVIATSEGLRVLEIDARLPSQTPVAVFHATGLNLVSLLARYGLEEDLPSVPQPVAAGRAVVCEHLRFRPPTLEVVGEHALADAAGLEVARGAFGADRWLSNCGTQPDGWVATAVWTGKTEAAAWEQRCRGIDEIVRAFGAAEVRDPEPGRPGAQT